MEVLKELKENYEQKDVTLLCTQTLDSLMEAYDYVLADFFIKKLGVGTGESQGKGRGPVIDVTEE